MQTKYSSYGVRKMVAEIRAHCRSFWYSFLGREHYNIIFSDSQIPLCSQTIIIQVWEN